MRGSNLTLTFGENLIYDNTSFIIEDNDKVGVVGVNGAGKTTLLKVILGEHELDSGKINNKKTVGYLPQEIIIEDESITVLEYLESGRPIKKLEQALPFRPCGRQWRPCGGSFPPCRYSCGWCGMRPER